MLVQAESDIRLMEVNSVVKNGIYHLDAVAEVRLPQVVRDALDNGVSLFFVTTLRIKKKKKFLWDKNIAQLDINRRLSFHALTKKYTVDDLTFNHRKSFSSLLPALKYLGRYRDVSVIGVSLAQPSPTTVMQVRIKLSRSELPVPLRMKSYLSRDWYLASDWREWPLR